MATGIGKGIANLMNGLVNEVLPEAKLREENSSQFEKGVSFVSVNNLLKDLADKKDFTISKENPDYQHFLIDLNSCLNNWKENWKKIGLDIDISINSINRIQ